MSLRNSSPATPVRTFRAFELAWHPSFTLAVEKALGESRCARISKSLKKECLFFYEGSLNVIENKGRSLGMSVDVTENTRVTGVCVDVDDNRALPIGKQSLL